MATFRLLLAAAILVLTWESTAGQISVPSRTLGFLFGGSDRRPAVELVAYLDPTCPDSQIAYPTLLRLAASYPPEQVQFRLHLHNLPYHRNSHTISKAAHVLDTFAPNKDTAFKWIGLIYSQIENFTTSATVELNDLEVLKKLSSLAVKLTGIAEADFTKMVADPTIDGLTRLDFKYGCSRGVHSTPMFTLNDVFLDANGWSFDTWKATIEKLLNN